MENSLLLFCKNSENWDFENNYCTGNCYPENVTVQFYNVDTQKVQMEWQTVWTQIRLLLKEQSDQSLHWLL